MSPKAAWWRWYWMSRRVVSTGPTGEQTPAQDEQPLPLGLAASIARARGAGSDQSANGPRMAAAAIQLQKQLGNQAVQAMMQDPSPMPSSPGLEASTSTEDADAVKQAPASVRDDALVAETTAFLHAATRHAAAVLPQTTLVDLYEQAAPAARRTAASSIVEFFFAHDPMVQKTIFHWLAARQRDRADASLVEVLTNRLSHFEPITPAGPDTQPPDTPDPPAPTQPILDDGPQPAP